MLCLKGRQFSARVTEVTSKQVIQTRNILFKLSIFYILVKDYGFPSLNTFNLKRSGESFDEEKLLRSYTQSQVINCSAILSIEHEDRDPTWFNIRLISLV